MVHSGNNVEIFSPFRKVEPVLMSLMNSEFDTIVKKALEVSMALACAVDGIDKQRLFTVLALGESYLYGLLHHEVISGEEHAKLVSTFQRAAAQDLGQKLFAQRAHGHTP